jgi:beta-1,4-mannosyltransferase
MGAFSSFRNPERKAVRIIAFPRAGNIYTEQLYAELERGGIAVLEGTWSNRWLRENLRRGDVIHVHWPSFLYAHSSRLRTGLRLAKMFGNLAFAKLRGAKIVWTAHNLYPHEGGRSLLSNRIGRKITVAFADYVCAHGSAAADIVTREFTVSQARLRIAHHPHWIDCYPNSLTQAECRAKLDIDSEDFVYLFIGRCRPYKGLEALIDAFRGVSQPARLLIVGSFSSAQYFETIAARAKAVPHVELVPRSIPDEELEVFLNAANCIVLPYRDVLTSGAALLALSFGRPVVAPDLGALRDHVDSRCGVLYPADQPQGLAHALKEIRGRKFDPRAIMEHARQFTWSKLADVLRDIVEERD